MEKPIFGNFFLHPDNLSKIDPRNTDLKYSQFKPKKQGEIPFANYRSETTHSFTSQIPINWILRFLQEYA